MLHLEDYLEMIEHLPQELRDRFTEMREMDLSVQNNTDALDKRARFLFQQCRRGELPTATADAEFDAIRSDYYRVLEDSDEKIQLAAQMYDLVERYQRRLDTELYKFKCELEADHNGITEILEKRSLELDSNTTSNGGTNQKENRFYDAQHSYAGTPSGRTDNRYKLKAVKRRESVAVTAAEKRSAAAAVAAAAAAAAAAVAAASSSTTSNVVPIANAHIRPTTPGSVTASLSTGAISTHPAVATPSAGNVPTYNLQICAAGNAIAAAASQAIAQTQQMQQGRRTASLKASYEAIGVMGSQDLLINSELAGATHNALQAVERESSVFSNQRRQKKKNITSSSSNNTNVVGARGTPTTTILSNSAVVAPMLATTNQLGQPSFTLQVQQPSMQQQVGVVSGQQTLPQQQPPVSVQNTQFPVQQPPMPVQQQIQLHLTASQVPLQHLQQVTHQQPILQQLSVQQQVSSQQSMQQTSTMKQQLLPQQMQIGNMNNQQQKHITLPHTATARLPRPPQPQQFQQTLQAQQTMASQLLQQTQQSSQTAQQTNQQQLSLQQLPLQSLTQPQLIQAQASHTLPLSQASQVQIQQLQQQQLVHPQAQQKSQLQQMKTLQSMQALVQTPQQQVIHLQSPQTQLQQMQPLQQHHHIQITSLQLQQQQSQQPSPHQQLHISQQQQPQPQPPQQQQQVQQQAQQLQMSQQQHQHSLIELQQKDSQLQQTIQQQQVLQQQQQLLQQTQQQSQLQVPHHLIQQQLSQKQQQTQPKMIQQTQTQQHILPGHTTSAVLTNLTTMDLLSTGNIPSSLSIASMDAGRTNNSTSTITNTSASTSTNNTTVAGNPAVMNDSGMIVEQTPEGEWSYDPNEPRYCFCNQVSYGDMVACDNVDCPFEWFHYPCVNITSSPKGKWYCPQCSSSMKRRASRKN